MKFIVLLLIYLIPFPGISQTTVPGGFVSGPWTFAGSPYLISGNITCGILEIEPGVDVRFQNGSGITVYGALKAVGTSLLPIIFEADDTTGWSDFTIPGGGHSGIYIPGNTTDTTVMDHCILRDAKGLISNTVPVGLLIYTTHFTLSNSEIYHNYLFGNPSVIRASLCSPQFINNSIHDNIGRLCGGIDIEASHGLISGNEIYNNTGSEGAAIFCVSQPDPGGPTIINNYIHHNHSYLDAGGIMIQNGPASVLNNTIAFNESARAGAGIYVMAAHAKIFSNRIYNNTDSIYPNCGINDGGGGILINNGPGIDTAEIFNNIIANNHSNFRGGGIRVAGGGGTVFIENNHIVNNSCLGGYFTGGLEFTDGVHGSVRNNIIWGNRGFDLGGNTDTVQILAGANDTFALEYNCVESSGIGAIFINTNSLITGNQSSNIPVFGINPGIAAPTSGAGIVFDATVANWHLISSSPCKDAGTTVLLTFPPLTMDVYGDPRVTGPAIDIGAVEYPGESRIEEPREKSISIFPNPSGNQIFVSGADPDSDINFYDVYGTLLFIEKYGQGIDVNFLSSGVYFLSLTDKNGTRSAKLIVSR